MHRFTIILLPLLAACTLAPAQLPPDTRPSVTAPDIIPPVGPAIPPSQEAMDLLKLLHERKQTLKDFTAKIDYSIYHPLTEDTGGKRGTLDFLLDPNKGPIFTVDFTVDTDEGKPKAANHQQIIFDGVIVLIKEFKPQTFMRNKVLADGSKPGGAVGLNGPLPLPIGIPPEDVAKEFEVSLLPSKDPNFPILKLVPRVPPPSGKFNFKDLVITVDKKLQLPTQIIQTAPGKTGDVTTYKLTEIDPNSNKARMQDTTPPPGWTERKSESAK